MGFGATTRSLLRSIDSAGEATARGIVQVNVCDPRISELPLYLACDLGTIAHICANDEMRSVIRTHGDETLGNVRRNLVCSQGSLSRAFAHVYGPGCPVGGKRWLVDVR